MLPKRIDEKVVAVCRARERILQTVLPSFREREEEERRVHLLLHVYCIAYFLRFATLCVALKSQGSRSPSLLLRLVKYPPKMDLVCI